MLQSTKTKSSYPDIKISHHIRLSYADFLHAIRKRTSQYSNTHPLKSWISSDRAKVPLTHASNFRTSPVLEESPFLFYFDGLST